MNNISDQRFRLTAILIFVAFVLVLSYATYEYAKVSQTKRFVSEQVKHSLEQTFGGLWDDARDSGSDDVVGVSVVNLLIEKYNIDNKNIHITSVGKSRGFTPPDNLTDGTHHSLVLNLADSQVSASIIMKMTNDVQPYIIATFFVLFGGALVFVLYPSYQPLGQYRLAKIYGSVFDRKVSSKKSWGSWQLTHLGTGSGMVNIRPNGFEQANNDKSVDTCIDGIKIAIDIIETAFSNSIKNFPEWSSNKKELANILKTIRDKMKDRPVLKGEEDVVSFISYVRDEALKTVIIDLTETTVYNNILGVESTDIEILSSARWLTDSYQIFMPRTVWENILRSLNNGVRMAYDTQITGINVYTNQSLPFIFMDFQVKDKILDNENVARLKEYIKRPYPGDLHDLVNAISHYGRLLILDPSHTIDLTNRKYKERGQVETLTVRFMLRRIDKDERKQLVSQMDKAVATRLNS